MPRCFEGNPYGGESVAAPTDKRGLSFTEPAGVESLIACGSDLMVFRVKEDHACCALLIEEYLRVVRERGRVIYLKVRPELRRARDRLVPLAERAEVTFNQPVCRVAGGFEPVPCQALEIEREGMLLKQQGQAGRGGGHSAHQEENT